MLTNSPYVCSCLFQLSSRAVTRVGSTSSSSLAASSVPRRFAGDHHGPQDNWPQTQDELRYHPHQRSHQLSMASRLFSIRVASSHTLRSSPATQQCTDPSVSCHCAAVGCAQTAVGLWSGHTRSVSVLRIQHQRTSTQEDNHHHHHHNTHNQALSNCNEWCAGQQLWVRWTAV